MEIDARTFKYPYFLGIGGIGMSALACHYLQKGCKVAGYDRVSTPLTQKLEEMGALIHYSENAELVPAQIDGVIYTPAIPASHGEWPELKARDLPVYKRAEVLGMLSRDYKTIAVAGTHGKTTTSALLAYLMNRSIGCNAILGGIVPDLGGNYLHNDHSGFLVTEADEYDRSFLELKPWFSAVTSWDADHFDIYGDLQTMRAAYIRFMRGSSHFIAEASLQLPFRPDYFYGMEGGASPQGAGAAWASGIHVKDGLYHFDYSGPKAAIKDLTLACPGRHNVENAVAAISLALEAGVSGPAIRRLLPLFKGVHRRLERCLELPGLVYYDDYAHHPAEIRASLQALREFYPDFHMLVVFQPHLYTRTRDLAEGFAQSLQEADELCLIDIYPAREEPIKGVDTHLIGNRIDRIPVSYTSMKTTLAWLRKRMKKRNAAEEKLLLVTMGAGDIDTLVEPIRRYLEGGHA